MLCCESSPGVQPGSGSCLAWGRFRRFSNHLRSACIQRGPSILAAMFIPRT